MQCALNIAHRSAAVSRPIVPPRKPPAGTKRTVQFCPMRGSACRSIFTCAEAASIHRSRDQASPCPISVPPVIRNGGAEGRASPPLGARKERLSAPGDRAESQKHRKRAKTSHRSFRRPMHGRQLRQNDAQRARFDLSRRPCPAHRVRVDLPSPLAAPADASEAWAPRCGRD